MASLFKPTRAFPLPADAEIVTRDGKPHARVKEKGKFVLHPLSANGKSYLKPAAKWAADVRLADGTRKRFHFSPNRDASAVMLADLLKKVESERSGLRDDYADHRDTAVADLLADYRRHHSDRGNTPKQGSLVVTRCQAVFAGCQFVRVRDLQAAAVEHWLAGRRAVPKEDGGFGPQTVNHYVAAVKAFGNWLERNRVLRENPFRFLTRSNVAVDTRVVRRALTHDEIVRLTDAATGGKSVRNLTGPDRAVLYTVAAYTGLRASELPSLTPESFRLLNDPPVVVVAAAYSKHRREDRVPLHSDLVIRLGEWLTGRPRGERLWPGTWSVYDSAKIIRKDLDAARRAWVAEAPTPAERQSREASDFLAYKDRTGAKADFHALRHTFVTNLVKSGLLPKDAKELARHSTITLTMDRYAHATLHEGAAAVDRLRGFLATPNPPKTPSNQAPDDAEVDRSCAAMGAATGGGGCLKLGEIGDISTVNPVPGEPQETLEFMGFDGNCGEVMKYARRDSNPQPAVPKTAALSS